jgi:hypothetical protein
LPASRIGGVADVSLATGLRRADALPFWLGESDEVRPEPRACCS